MKERIDAFELPAENIPHEPSGELENIPVTVDEESLKKESGKELVLIKNLCLLPGDFSEDNKNQLLEIDRQIIQGALSSFEKIHKLKFSQLDRMDILEIYHSISEYFKKRLKTDPSQKNEYQIFFVKLFYFLSPIIGDGSEHLRLEEVDGYDSLVKKESLSREEIFDLLRIKIKLRYIEDCLTLPENWKNIDFYQFDPYFELDKISNFDKNITGGDIKERQKQKKQRLENYKNMLASQKEGIAETIIALEKMIRENPDIEHKLLHDFIYEEAKKYKLSNNQLGLFENGLNKYRCRHETIKTYREEFDDRELFKLCFGKYPSGKIEVVLRPLAFYFRVFDFKDYSYIHSGKYMHSDSGPGRLDKKSAKMSAGVKLHKCLIPELNDCITVEKVESGDSDDAYNSRYKLEHEEFHVIEELFTDQNNKGIFLKDLEKAPIEYKKYLAMNALRTERTTFEENAKSEILAYYLNNRNFKEIAHILCRKNGLYDYFGQFLKSTEYDTINDFLKYQGIGFFYRRQLFKKVFVAEYEKIIESAVVALRKMDQLTVRHSWPKKKLIYYLKNEGIKNWPNTLDRLEEVMTEK